jgi:demethylmenaquinone methyltransferase/2-methoxy-6-polyprenyl-1,4-benzoquinol methylase
MIERAREKYGNDQIEYICKDFFEYDSKEGYDYAIAYSCLPHFVERRKFLLKAKEMLRKDGKLVIAHSESREKINCHHREMKSDIEFKDLERIEELSTLGKEIGLNVIRTIDTEEMYVLEMTLGQG